MVVTGMKIMLLWYFEDALLIQFMVKERIYPGETVGLVILGSDKIHLTVYQGDKECHAVYMTCGNIKKALRTKLSGHCWMMIAQIPVAKFEQSKHQGLLTNRLLHKCLDIVLKNLKKCASAAELMVDPSGGFRRVRTFLAAYIADLPEQQSIACVTTNYAPSSLAGPSELGNECPSKIRTSTCTLKTIEEINEKLRQANAQGDLTKTRKVAKDYGLNGVDKPFWRDWLHADPPYFLAPDALHQWHKFFMDHPLEWAKVWLGNEEFDRRLSVLQPRIGFRHFRNGFTRFRQHTGKEAKDLERVFLPVIAGHENVTDGILTAMRSLMHFIFLGSYESHSDITLKYLEDALKKFHIHKHHVAASGVRSGIHKSNSFNIAKLELMQHVSRLIRQLGSVPQFSSEQTERLHKDMPKLSFKGTNQVNYSGQMCRFLDRQERI